MAYASSSWHVAPRRQGRRRGSCGLGRVRDSPFGRTGKELWQTGHLTDYRDDFGFDEGPRATPAITEARVFTLGAEGRLICWSLADGTAVWGVDTQKEFGSPKGFFGRACSPLVESNLVILNPATMPRVWNIEGTSTGGTVVRNKDASCVAWSCESAKSAGASRA